MFDLSEELKKLKESAKLDNLGMILIHNGVVRATSKDGKPVKGMNLTFNRQKLDKLKDRLQSMDFIEGVVIWINEGRLKIGDDIMYVIIAGNRREKLLPIFQKTIEEIKTEIVEEIEE
ncbi:molybdenum cofactor biosynthesis protein MoaE [Hippea sp. KM1]|uniref:molybdenum cofactor biosynthesis protein MoaE n=1 Tax=Hippea sp. KM1 TaxID=944481 RepID=UPI00046D6DF2|nr:molybdenum cofactor biosynthesis protein MoaE [Hippea sp. KM1]